MGLLYIHVACVVAVNCLVLLLDALKSLDSMLQA
jgi:hypothetical protein